MAVLVYCLSSCAVLNEQGSINEATYETPVYGETVDDNNNNDDIMKISEITNEFDFSKDYYSQVMSFAEDIAISFYNSPEFGYTKEEAKNLELGKPYQILKITDNNISAQGALCYPIYCNGEIRGIITITTVSNGDEDYLLGYDTGLSVYINTNSLTEKDFVFVIANNNLYAYCSDNSVIFLADYSYPMTNESSPDDYPKIDFNDISEFAFVNEVVERIYFDESRID